MPGQPVILDTLGGLVCTARPEDSPEGASPRTIDTDFIVGRFIQRPGEQNVYSYSGVVFGPRNGTTAVDVDTTGFAWSSPGNILADDGSFTVATTGGALALSITLVQGIHGSIANPVSGVIVTFASDAYPVGTLYSFSGLTNFTYLNGKALLSQHYTLAANQAFFAVPTSAFAPTADTGIAIINAGSQATDELWITEYGFPVPSTSSIVGVTVTPTGFCSAGTIFAQLLLNGVPVGNIRSATLPLTNGPADMGGPTDRWGWTPDYANVDNSTFGVKLWATAAGILPVSLDSCSISISGTTSSVNFKGLLSADLNESDQVTIALDANGLSWEEDVTNAPNELSLQSLIPAVEAEAYLKGVDAGGTAYMAYSDLTQGVSPPMQFNGQWCDRITQVGPGAPPTFTASTEAGVQSSITAYSASGGIVTLTVSPALASAYTPGLLVTMGGFTGGLAPLNGLVFSVLGSPAPNTTSFAISTSLISGSGSDAGTATPQYTYPIVASPNGIVQPPQMSDPDAPGRVNTLLWSDGPGSKSPGTIITVYYSNSFEHSTPDETLVNAFNSGFPVYVYIASQPFGNGVWQVTSIGNAIPPGGAYYRWYFTYQVPTLNYQQYGGPDDAPGTYQITQATLTTTTAVPGLAAGAQVSLAGVTASAWDGNYTIVQALNSGSFSISQSELNAGTATYTWALVSGSAPVAGQLVTITGTLNANGLLNVTNAVIASATGVSSGTFTVDGFATTTDYPITVETGQATTAGTQFIIDPGAALVGSTSQSPILGNSGGGTLTIVGAAAGGTFPIGAGTRQGVVFGITRNGAVTRPSPPFTFTVTTGANYITASQIPIGPGNWVARGIAFTEAGQNGVPGTNFYTYDTPVIFTVNGVKYTASALIVPDNTTTEMKFTFSDGVLLSSDEIDIEGNNYFNLIEIGDPAWIFQYADRMFYGLCRTKIQNFLNMSFDGGYLPTNSLALPQPLGWNSNFSGIITTYAVTAFQITGTSLVTFTAANNMIAGDLVIVNGLSVGTYLNGIVFTVLSANSATFSATFSHANVGLTADTGTAGLIDAQTGLVTSPIFGNAYQYVNQSNMIASETTLLFQGAYQDAYNVAILQPNTPYSVRVTARALNQDAQKFYVNLVGYQPGAGTTVYGSSTFTVNQGAMVTQTAVLTTGIPVIPISLIISVGLVHADPGAGFQIDRIDVFPTNHPVDDTTIWSSYADSFEAVDIVTGQLGVGGDNPQPAQGASQILEQLYIEKTKSRCVTQDSPNYEPNQWKVSLVTDSPGSVGPNAFDEQEEFLVSAARTGLSLFDGGKPMPIMRELQSSGTRGSLWEAINWEAGNSIWVRNDILQRRLYVGIPMITPNFWLPNDPELTPTSPNIILMCNYTGCPTADELAMSSEVHVTMFGDMKALDMRRKWSLWRTPSPVGEFIKRGDGLSEPLFICNGINSSKIYQFVPGAADGTGQNTDDGATINWLYTTYGFTKAKQGQQQPGLGALRKIAYYLTATMEGIGQVTGKLYSNSLGALVQNTFTIPLPFTLSSPQQNDQERVVEIGGQRIFVEFSALGTGGYAEVGPVILDMEADKWSPHRGVSS